MEATPNNIDMADVRESVRAVAGVEDIHDVHIRTVTSGLIAMSAHVELSDMQHWPDVLQAVSMLLRDRFGIAHATLQPEEPHGVVEVFRGCALDAPHDGNACRVITFPPAHRPNGHQHDH